MARQHQSLQQWLRGESFLSKFIKHNVRDVQRRFEADKIQKRERTHWIPAPKLHAFINVTHGSHTFFQRADGIEQIRHQETIHNEPGPIGRPYGYLAQASTE